MREKDSAPEEEIFEDDLETKETANIENNDTANDDIDVGEKTEEGVHYIIDEDTDEIIMEAPDTEDDDIWEDEEDDGRGGGAKIIFIALLVAAATAVAGFFMYRNLARENRKAAMEAMTEETVAEGSATSEEMTEEETSEMTELPAERVTEQETTETIAEPETTAWTVAGDTVSTDPADALPAQTGETSGSTVTVGETDNTDVYELIEVADGAPEADLYSSQYSGAEETGGGTDIAAETRTASVVMIGDIRFREMANISEIENCGWACSSSADYDWFFNNACPGADAMIASGTKVFISVGLNDIERYAEYAVTIKEMAAKWQERGASVYFVAVGPVAPESGVSNNDICTFNTYMFQNLDIPFIDAYNYLVSNGFSSVSDQSKSYSDETTLALYNYIIQFI